MKNRQISLVDLGLDNAFGASMAFVEAVIRNINVGFSDPVAEVSFVRTRDFRVITDSVLSKVHVLHVMAHGDHAKGPTFSSSDDRTHFSLELLRDLVEATGDGINAYTVIADACSTGTGVWQRVIRDCLEHDICYIGTNRAITWHDSTVFCSAFYAALLRNKGKGKTPIEQAMDACQRAIAAYEQVTDKTCPFKAVELNPSRAARKYVVD